MKSRFLRNISLCVFYILGLDKPSSSTETVPAALPESEEKSKRLPFVLIDMV